MPFVVPLREKKGTPYKAAPNKEESHGQQVSSSSKSTGRLAKKLEIEFMKLVQGIKRSNFKSN